MEFLIILLLIILNGFFAMSEIAMISARRSNLEMQARQGDAGARQAQKLIEDPDKFLSTIQIGITLIGILTGIYSGDALAAKFGRELALLGIPLRTATIAAQVTIVVIVTYLTLIFGELVPKRIGMNTAEKIACAVARPMRALSVAASPFVWLLSRSTAGVTRLLGLRKSDSKVTEEEIRMMVDAGGEKGTIDRSEQEIIQNVFEFDDLTAGEIATHRTDIVILWEEDDDKEWEKTIYEHRYSQFPVCGESVDDVIGILNSKDYFRLADRSRKNVMENAVRAPYFVPEAVKADVLFRDMQHSRRGFVVVLDEYGGMSGILTMNDLVEQLVGDLDDEDDVIETEEDIVHLPDGNWRIRGSALIEDVAEQLNIKLPCDEYDTFGGYVFATLGRIADDGTTFSIETDIMNIDVLEIRDHRIETTVVRLKEQPQGDDSDSDKD